MIGPKTGCRWHRPVLVDLVDRGERGPATAEALDHMAGCPSCEHELTELALTIAALRRAGTTYRALPVPRLATRAPVPPVRHRGPWAWRLQLGSLATGAVLAVMLVFPQPGIRHDPAPTDAGASVPPATTMAWREAEQRLAARPDVAHVVAIGSLPPRYPEGLTRPWKEVPASDAAARELEPQ